MMRVWQMLLMALTASALLWYVGGKIVGVW